LRERGALDAKKRRKGGKKREEERKGENTNRW
jgi:hypothetical protein